jgi:hypothetical protein
MAEYIPFSDLEEAELGAVRWLVDLPDYAPTEKIGLNITALGKLAHIGGFRHLDVRSFSGGKDSVSLSPNGLNEDGSGTASAKASVTKAKKITTKTFDDEGLVCQTYSTGYIGLNTSTMTEQLSHKGKLRDPEAWSTQLDGHLRSGLRRATASNTVTLSRTAALGLIYTPIPLLNDHPYANPEATAANLATTAMITLAAAALVGYAVGRTKDEIRYSTVCGLQLDRLATVYGVTAVKKLVKPVN